MFGNGVATYKEGKNMHEFMVLKLKVVGDKIKNKKKEINDIKDTKDIND